jgi:hypothetical protein
VSASPAGPALEASRGRTIGQQLAPACPTPTSDGNAGRIATFLEAAPTSPGLDLLSTEWERLDQGARACRSGGR